MNNVVGSPARPWLAVVVALTVGFVLTLLVSEEPVHAYRALLGGPLPDIRWSAETGLSFGRVTRFAAVLEDAIALTLLGLAVAIPMRARQFSMGADGQFFLSALAAMWVGVQFAGTPGLATAAALLSAVTVGFAWGLIPGLLKARWQANEIVTTLMLNVLAIQLYRLVLTHAFGDPTAGYVASPALPASVAFTPLLAASHVTVFLLAIPLAAALAWWLIERSTLGYEIRAVGESPAFARHSGMPAARTVALAMALGGAFAGLAGAHLSLAQLQRLPGDLLPGLGFEGLMVALLARNAPARVPLAALAYAYLKAGGLAMERASDVSREVVLIVQALIVLFVVCEQWRLPAGMTRVWLRWRSRQEGA